MIAATLDRLRTMGSFYADAERGVAVDTRVAAYPQMPPLVGSDDDVEALANYLASLDPPESRPLETALRGGE
jgi:hypothetical protein